MEQNSTNKQVKWLEKRQQFSQMIHSENIWMIIPHFWGSTKGLSHGRSNGAQKTVDRLWWMFAGLCRDVIIVFILVFSSFRATTCFLCLRSPCSLGSAAVFIWIMLTLLFPIQNPFLVLWRHKVHANASEQMSSEVLPKVAAEVMAL